MITHLYLCGGWAGGGCGGVSLVRDVQGCSISLCICVSSSLLWATIIKGIANLTELALPRSARNAS